MRFLNVAIVLALLALPTPVALAQHDAERSISCGCSGGFTGGGSGVTVLWDGAILRWSRPTYRDSLEESLIRSDPRAARQFFAQLDEMNFTSIHYKKTGNMTCHLTLRQGSTTHAVAWEPGDSSAPPLVVALASRLQRLALPVESN